MNFLILMYQNVDDLYDHVTNFINRDLNLTHILINDLNVHIIKEAMRPLISNIVNNFTNSEILRYISYISPEKLKFYIDLQVQHNLWNDRSFYQILNDYLTDTLYHRIHNNLINFS